MKKYLFDILGLQIMVREICQKVLNIGYDKFP